MSDLQPSTTGPPPRPAPKVGGRTTARWILSVAAFSLCALMTAWLLHRELGSSQGQLVVDENLRLDEPRESHLGIYVGEPEDGNRVGHVTLRQLPEIRERSEGTLLEVDLGLDLQLFGRATRLSLEGTSWGAWRGGGRDFDFAVRSAGSEFRLVGEVEEGRLQAVVHSAGEEFPLEIPLPPDALLQPSLGTALSFPVLEVGQSAVVPTFDPITLGPGRARVRAIRRQQMDLGSGPRPVRVYRVETSGFTSEAWVDERGEIVRATTPLGLTLALEQGPEGPVGGAPSRGAALQGTDLLRRTAVVPAPSGPQVQRGLVRLVARLRIESDPSQWGRELSDDGAESARDGAEADVAGAFDVTVQPPRDAFQQTVSEATPEPPATGPSVEGSADTGATGAGTVWRFSASGDGDHAPPEPSHLAADPFVQSDHPRIVAASREVLSALPEDATDAERALAIYEWVWTRIDKQPVLGVPSALEVLGTLRGDCNEHTILYTALARAAGLPTRIAIGLVWSEELAGFYYHAWPEVWLGDAWRRYDPTLGQQRADATHIKLLEGGIERWPQLLAFLGRLQIEVLEIE